jgi:antitoxin (DNA-binding transcriptional repressor) of toxin-antitoxin stability system
MKMVQVDEAGAQLPQLIEAAERGETVLITRPGRPAARLVVPPPEEEPDAGEAARPREGGQLRGQIWIAPDFDELPEDIARAFGMID